MAMSLTSHGHAESVLFSFKPYFFYQSAVFLFHNKLINNNFSLNFSDQRTDPIDSKKEAKALCWFTRIADHA